MADQRIVKVPLPLDLIRRMDQALVEGSAGVSTRAEFIREASENFLAEVSYQEAPPEPTGNTPEPQGGAAVQTPTEMPEHSLGPQPGAPVIREILNAVPTWEQEELRLSDLAGTSLRLRQPPSTLETGLVRPSEGPLLGLHNRDYPSFWAAHRLARYTEEELVRLDDFRLRVTNAAWFYAAELGALPAPRNGARLQALFPSNPDKRESAEGAFQNFAIGSIPRRSSGASEIEASGPLFVWRLCQLARRDGELWIGLTPAGKTLLEQLEGLSLDFPHDPEAAGRFLSHLANKAPGDRWGFDQIVLAIANEPSRQELVAAVSGERPAWTPATASSIAQGYVARAREWGLIEPRLIDGRYRLTKFGKDFLGRIETDRKLDTRSERTTK